MDSRLLILAGTFALVVVSLLALVVVLIRSRRVPPPYEAQYEAEWPMLMPAPADRQTGDKDLFAEPAGGISPALSAPLRTGEWRPDSAVTGYAGGGPVATEAPAPQPVIPPVVPASVVRPAVAPDVALPKSPERPRPEQPTAGEQPPAEDRQWLTSLMEDLSGGPAVMLEDVSKPSAPPAGAPPAPVIEPAPAIEPEPAPEPAPAPAPAIEPEPAPTPEPPTEPAPAPVIEPKPAPVPVIPPGLAPAPPVPEVPEVAPERPRTVVRAEEPAKIQAPPTGRDRPAVSVSAPRTGPPPTTVVASIPLPMEADGSAYESAAPAPTVARPEGIEEHILVAPVEMWFGEARIGVKKGTRTYDLFQRYATVLFEEYKRATSGS